MFKSIFSDVNLNNKTKISNIVIDELVEIKKLLKSKFAVDIQNVINQYYLGNFNEVLKLLTKETMVYFSNLLYSYRKDSNIYPTYEKVRLLLKLYLNGLTKCITQYLEIENIKITLSKCKERCKILDNMEKLQEYINGLNRTVNLFNSIPPINVVEAKILLEHATYLRLYGYPIGGIFDTKLLNDIITEQNSKNNETLSTK